MSPSRVEQQVRGFMGPLVAALDALGISPNALTVLGLLLNFAAAWVVATGELVYGAIAFLVASAFDMLDGSLARRRGQASRLGAFLDSTTSYARARSESLGQDCKVGWVERPERVVILVIGLVLGRTVLGYAIFALAILSWITVVQRIVHVARNIDRDE